MRTCAVARPRPFAETKDGIVKINTYSVYIYNKTSFQHDLWFFQHLRRPRIIVAFTVIILYTVKILSFYAVTTCLQQRRRCGPNTIWRG